MKIVSKYKDYYDYLVGVYGLEEKIVYVRQADWRPTFLEFPNQKNVFYVSICDFLFLVYYKNGKFYYGPKGQRQMLKDGFVHDYAIYKQKVKSCWGNYTHEVGIQKGEAHGFSVLVIPTDINTQLGCPIVVSESVPKGRYYLDRFEHNPKLSDLNIGRVIKPETIWFLLTDWFSREKDMEDKRTDEQKAQSKGFVKGSFTNVGGRIKKKKPRRKKQ